MIAALLINVAAQGATAKPCELPSVQQAPTKTSLVRIDGAVERETQIDRGSVESRPSTSIMVDQPSTAGPIKGRFTGVPLIQLLSSASPNAPARKNSLIGFVVVARASDGYAVALSYAETDPKLTRTPALVAFSCNGRPISPTLVLPGDRDSTRYVHELDRLTLVDADTTAGQ